MTQLNSPGGSGKGANRKRVSSPEASHMLYRYFPSTAAQEEVQGSGSSVEKQDAILVSWCVYMEGGWGWG